MKKYRFFASLTLTALLALGTLAWAQDSTPSGGQTNATSGTGTAENDPAENRVRHIADQLNLTPEQRDQIRPIVKQEAEQIQAVRNDNSLTPEQKQAKLREIHQTFRPQIAKVLTPEQKQKFKEMKEEGREHHRGMRGGVPPKDR